ncbi:N-acetylglucosaminyl-L-malate N-acetyl hydrolase [hydrothermal vent metagenome]|uniref:N-acetylglucosaminyl-L-malate N-acetyl hydrolase n=1 Tax=hydrothermal vent metagenome TaxID=652676 RepID=A0A3B1DFV0_9ZZZZ
MTSIKLDILALAAHPDDVELSCGGTIAKYCAMGKKVGIVDFTMGQMGTNGSPELRLEESANAAKIFGLAARENLGLQDVLFEDTHENQLKVVNILRKYQPDILLINAPIDRHPDHVKASKISTSAVFLSGLKKIETVEDGNKQNIWRPKAVYHYIQSQVLTADFVLDVSAHLEVRNKAIWAFKSQLHDPTGKADETFISSPEFLKMLDAHGKVLGHSIGVKFGEGFISARNIGVSNLFDLL